MTDEIKRKRGRPKKRDSMRDRFQMFLSPDMSQRLDELSKMTGMTRADIFREAFDGYEKMKRIQCDQVDNVSDFYEEYDNYDDFEYDEYEL